MGEVDVGIAMSAPLPDPDEGCAGTGFTPLSSGRGVGGEGVCDRIGIEYSWQAYTSMLPPPVRGEDGVSLSS
jgi:hypothetical protein